MHPPPDLDCDEISEKNFRVTGSDPHDLDRDGDGRGCESGSTSKGNDKEDDDEDRDDGQPDDGKDDGEYKYKQDRENACEGGDCGDTDEYQPDGCVYRSQEHRTCQ
jgi:hypothetical protein